MTAEASATDADAKAPLPVTVTGIITLVEPCSSPNISASCLSSVRTATVDPANV